MNFSQFVLLLLILTFREVSKKLNKHLIVNKVKTINHWFKKNLGKKPSIGVLGLNPHNAEYRKNSEEMRIIIPAIKKCKALGANIKVPLCQIIYLLKITKIMMY